MNELQQIQEQRGKLYGSFKEHCENVKRIMSLVSNDEELVGLFYIVSKAVRWQTCPTKENLDSLFDLCSYLDLIVQKRKGTQPSFNYGIDKDVFILKDLRLSKIIELATESRFDEALEIAQDYYDEQKDL